MKNSERRRIFDRLKATTRFGDNNMSSFRTAYTQTPSPQVLKNCAPVLYNAHLLAVQIYRGNYTRGLYPTQETITVNMDFAG